MWSKRLELLRNLKTAKALGLTVPPALPVRADEGEPSGLNRIYRLYRVWIPE